MFTVPEHFPTTSMLLSEVLSDVGVNETMIQKKRRANSLQETCSRIRHRLIGKPLTEYMLGSHCEGSTTRGLKSDRDVLVCNDNFNVIQNQSEWIRGKQNLMVVEDALSPPGYCLLQSFRNVEPLPATEITTDFEAEDMSGRILYKNTVLNIDLPKDRTRQGPALSIQGATGLLDEDRVVAYPFKSWPKAVRLWFEMNKNEQWPTENVKRDIEKTKTFLVGVGSNISENADFEWRISTSLAERCLMHNLNITQIRCYVLMKMMMKTYINPYHGAVISSYICKTVLFYCIRSKDKEIWKNHSLLNCLQYCLHTLYNCILHENCPHFMVKGNNLLAGKFSHQGKRSLLRLTLQMMHSIDKSVLGIQTDNLGIRLQLKLKMISQAPCNLLSATDEQLLTSGRLITNSANYISHQHKFLLLDARMNMQHLSQTITNLGVISREGNALEKKVCDLVAPLFCTSLGCIKASLDIGEGKTVSWQARGYMHAGEDSDVASSRLKMASVFYCTMEMDKAVQVLRDIESRYQQDSVEVICSCSYYVTRKVAKHGFCVLANVYEEERIREITDYCVRFLRTEINCVPHELKYEMYRSTNEDLAYRGEFDGWMDWAVVDSLPYLFFLQYKVFDHQQQNGNKVQALNDLIEVTEKEPNLGHRETAFNLLGQCMEQENRPMEALQYYVKSIEFRKRNNAAKVLVCLLLAKLFLGKKWKSKERKWNRR